MVYLDYFKAEFKRSFFLYSIIVAIYLIVCLLSETKQNVIEVLLSATIVVLIGVLIKAFRRYKNKEAIKGTFDWP